MSNQPKDGGPAFPFGVPASIPQHGAYSQKGMSLRDHFAGLAMQGYLTEGRLRTEVLEGNKEVAGIDISVSYYNVVAICSYRMAEAMLKERSKV